MSDDEKIELWRLADCVEKYGRATRRLGTVMKVHAESHKAMEADIADIKSDLWGKGGIKDQVVGWKAVVGFVGFVCGVIGALIAKLWK